MRNTAFIIDGLALRDPRGQQASINGHINMQSPSNPLIQATINTSNFLVLNTDFRDNPYIMGRLMPLVGSNSMARRMI